MLYTQCLSCIDLYSIPYKHYFIYYYSRLYATVNIIPEETFGPVPNEVCRRKNKSIQKDFLTSSKNRNYT